MTQVFRMIKFFMKVYFRERNAMKALLVVDVQTNVMKRRNTEGLIEACNDIISQYEPEQVIYVVHKLPWERASKKKEFGAGLSVVSDYVFDKREGDAFSNPKLLQRPRR